DLVSLVAGGPEPEKAELIGLGRAQSSVEQEMTATGCRQKNFRGRDIDVDAVLVLRSDQLRNREIEVVFVLHAHRDLRRGRIHGIAEDSDLDAENLLAELRPRQLERLSQRAEMQPLFGR